MAAAVLCGCALENPSIRRLPPETPAADNAAAIVRADERAAAARQASTREPPGLTELQMASRS